MIKEIYNEEQRDNIMNRLFDALDNAGKNSESIMFKSGYESVLKFAFMNESEISSIMDDSIVLRNEKDELLLSVPFLNLTELFKQYL